MPVGLLSDEPVAKPTQWTGMVNGVETEGELKALRQSVDRGTPFGEGICRHRRRIPLEI